MTSPHGAPLREDDGRTTVLRDSMADLRKLERTDGFWKRGLRRLSVGNRDGAGSPADRSCRDCSKRHTSPGCRSHVLLACGRGTAVVGHDRVGEFLVVRFVVWFLTIQGFDLRDCLTSEYLSVPRDAKLTRPVNVRRPTIARADKLAQR